MCFVLVVSHLLDPEIQCVYGLSPQPSLYKVTAEYLGVLLQCHACGQHFYSLTLGFETVMQLVVLF